MIKTHQAKTQLTKTPFKFPRLKIIPDINCIEDMEKLSFKDFELHDYNHHPVIRAEMAV